MKGKVYLVGAGPGDPELLTVKALRLLQKADAVLYDDLVPPEILSLVSRAAQLHNVGKRCGKKKIQQEEINFLMIALADSGLQVVRLKSGDPLIFGRAGEEMEALRKAKISYEVVPGVTSALGAAAIAGIPLTHRRQSSALVLITAHQAGDIAAASWSKLAVSGSTLVIYMPGQNYSELASRLRAAGLPEETPCAVISRATTASQTTHRTTIADLRYSPKLVSPTLLVVGEVVRLADPTLQETIRTSSETEFALSAAFLADYPSRIASAGDEEPLA
jgi:uroporphyrin-III C-methyltransferase